MFLVHQDIAIPRFAFCHINNSFVGVLHWSRLDPRLDIVVHRELEHLLDLLRRPNAATANFDTTQKCEGVDLRQFAAIGSTKMSKASANAKDLVKANIFAEDLPNLDEDTIDLQQGQVSREGHVLVGNRADNQVN